MSVHSPRGWRWQQYRAQFLASNRVCHLCGDPIDLVVRYPDPMSGCIDHLVPVSWGGSKWDPANHRAAHRICNMRRGAKPVPATGNPSRVW